jgi:hypothetical protein
MFLLEPEVWGVNTTLVQLARWFVSQSKQLGAPVYLVGWPDGTRAVITTHHPPGSEGWRRGIPAAYCTAVEGEPRWPEKNNR